MKTLILTDEQISVLKRMMLIAELETDYNKYPVFKDQQNALIDNIANQLKNQ